MQESVENSPNVHTQGFIIKICYSGVSAWSRLFLDGLTNGHFATGNPSVAKYTLMSLSGNYVKSKEEIQLQKLKEDFEKVVSILEEDIKI
jgi:hypothetical protein